MIHYSEDPWKLVHSLRPGAFDHVITFLPVPLTAGVAEALSVLALRFTVLLSAEGYTYFHSGAVRPKYHFGAGAERMKAGETPFDLCLRFLWGACDPQDSVLDPFATAEVKDACVFRLLRYTGFTDKKEGVCMAHPLARRLALCEGA